MNSFVRLPAERRRLLCEEAQARLGLAAASIEKDFWVCWTLQALFGLPGWGEHLTFKGGTSLSKGWRLIARLSEDIDVVTGRDFLGFGDERLGSTRQKKLLKECSRRIQSELGPKLDRHLKERLPEEETWELALAAAEEDPDQQTLLFHYPTAFQAPVAYVRRVVKIELGARSDTEPVETPVIQPYLAEAFPDLLKESAFPLRTVSPRRTFWEKAMLLHEEMFRPAEKPRKAGLSRHYYDLWCLIQAGVAAEAASDPELFDRVAAHRRIFFKQRWVDYEILRKGSLHLVPPADQEGEWRKDYDAMREEMFFREPPTFDEVISTVRTFEEEFNRA